jgi:hypothetical protein
VEGVNFSLIWAVILRAIRDLSGAEEGWVLRVRVGVSPEEEDIVEIGIVGSLEIGSSDTI